MTTKEQAERKINAAAIASGAVLGSMRKVGDALSSTATVNGFGVIRDHYAMRRQLEVAHALIQESLITLAAVEWPSDADYDMF